MKKNLIFFIFALTAITISAKIPIEKAIKNGIKISSELRDNSLESKILKADNRIKRSAGLLNINTSFNYLYRSEKVEINLPDIQAAPGMTIPGMEIRGGTNHTYDLSVKLIQPIFTGYTVSGMIKTNELQQALNLSRRKLLELMLTGRIKTIYFNHLLFSRQISSITTLEKKIRNHLGRLEDLFREDLVGKSSILETRLKLREISLSKEEIENTLDTLTSVFLELTDHKIEEISKTHRENIGDKKSSMEIFISEHPSLKLLSDQKKLIRVNKKITNGKDLPKVGGFAEIHYGIPGINFLGDEWGVYFQGGISVSMEVFNWGRSKKANSINNLKLEKLKNRELDLTRRTRFRLSELFSTLESLEKRETTFDEMIRISEEESDLKKMLFEEKQISNKDYLDSVLNVENLRSLKEKTSLQTDLIKVEINTMIGKKGEK